MLSLSKKLFTLRNIWKTTYLSAENFINIVINSNHINPMIKTSEDNLPAVVLSNQAIEETLIIVVNLSQLTLPYISARFANVNTFICLVKAVLICLLALNLKI